MKSTSILTDDILVAFRACQYKAHLKLKGTVCEGSNYSRFQAPSAAEYQTAAQVVLSQTRRGAVTVQNPPSLLDAIRGGADLVFAATITVGDESCRLHAIERVAGADHRRGESFTPILFTQHIHVTPEDRFRFCGAPRGCSGVVRPV